MISTRATIGAFAAEQLRRAGDVQGARWVIGALPERDRADAASLRLVTRLLPDAKLAGLLLGMALEPDEVTSDA